MRKKKKQIDPDMPVGKITRIKDFLPPPEKLVMPKSLRRHQMKKKSIYDKKMADPKFRAVMKSLSAEDIKLTKQEQAIENALIRGDYVPVSKKEFDEIAEAIARYKKDTVLNIRINSQDLQNIKRKAKKLGVKYQTFISEVLHKIAEA
jgi:predicted DNA binding CopG/RHH family protein